MTIRGLGVERRFGIGSLGKKKENELLILKNLHENGSNINREVRESEEAKTRGCEVINLFKFLVV